MAENMFWKNNRWSDAVDIVSALRPEGMPVEAFRSAFLSEQFFDSGQAHPTPPYRALRLVSPLSVPSDG